jgi:hypothetical protein
MVLDLGYQTAMSTTNNIFVNCNVQAYPGLASIDVGEQDLEYLPMGFVNVHDFPAGDTTYDKYRSLPRRYLFEKNVIYWDPTFTDMISTLNTNSINGVSNWMDQMIIMNSRTSAMFADDATHPYLILGTNYTEVPAFTDSKDLLTTQVSVLKTFALSTVDTNSTAVLPDWRLVNIGPDFYVYSDWPIPVDLSYTNPTLLTGATGGFPVGDLNWFPARKADWLAQRTAEYAAIDAQIGISTDVADQPDVPVKFQLEQNYPNPFNPSTTISFSLSRAGMTTLKVFNALGQEVATLVNGNTDAGTHEVQFNAAGLATGVYFYKLTSGGFAQVMKMALVK